jgi:methanogenic corrinoid protein MtbC1
MKGVKRGIDFRRFWLSLLRGRFELARTTIDDLLRCYRPQQLYLRLFVPTLSLSGTMFALGRINYHDEHRVTWGCLRLMRYVRSRMPLPSPNGLSALATGVGQDSHRIGLRMVCDLMESVGWNVHFLSTNERGTLRHAIQQYRPDALLLSIGRREEFDQAKRMIGEARRTGFTGVIAVGGRAVASEPNALSILGADLTAANGLDLARKITLWSRSRRHQPAPEPAHPLTRQSA